MKEVIVITGGAGGMGLATAKLLGRQYHLVIHDVDQHKLDVAVRELEKMKITATALRGDIADKISVRRLVEAAMAVGHVRGVIHTAGVSPQMGNAKFIIDINAVGTVYITEAFLEVADAGFSLVNVSSIAGHMLPRWMIPKRLFALALSDIQRFRKKLLTRASFIPPKMRSGQAYALSKAFVIWYTAKMAAVFGAKGARVVSISPGVFDTSMGRLEEKNGSGRLVDYAAIKRYGKPEEVAELLAFLGSGKAGYITGTDILIDGGVNAGMGFRDFLQLALGRHYR